MEKEELELESIQSVAPPGRGWQAAMAVERRRSVKRMGGFILNATRESGYPPRSWGGDPRTRVLGVPTLSSGARSAGIPPAA